MMEEVWEPKSWNDVYERAIKLAEERVRGRFEELLIPKPSAIYIRKLVRQSFRQREKQKKRVERAIAIYLNAEI